MDPVRFPGIHQARAGVRVGIPGFFRQGNWYTDATFTTVIGGFTFPCGGLEVSWGKVSQ